MSLQCEHLENPKSGRDFYYYFLDGTEAGFLCDYCAVENGFCPLCGYFVLGSGDDRTLSSHSCCTECLEVLKDELGEYDE